jgi:hypothetical protein
MKPIQARMQTICSIGLGGIIRIKPCPLINEEKLETQNGIKNKRNVCQL